MFSETISTMFLQTVREYHQKNNLRIHGVRMIVCWSETHSSEVNIYPMKDLQLEITVPWTTACSTVVNTQE